MLDPNQIRDALIEFLDDHRRKCKDPACTVTEDVAGFLLHCLGIRSDMSEAVMERLRSYEASCENCQHLRN